VFNAATEQDKRFTHLLPIYVFPANQIEVSGFLQKGDSDDTEVRSPYPPARSQVGNFWRCGPPRAKFITESVWDLKQGFERAGCNLAVRAGMLYDVAADALDWFDGVEGKEDVPELGEQWTKDAHAQRGEVVGVWMTSDDSVEESRDERAVKKMVERRGQEFRLFRDEKYYIDEYVLQATSSPHPMHTPYPCINADVRNTGLSTQKLTCIQPRPTF